MNTSCIFIIHYIFHCEGRRKIEWIEFKYLIAGLCHKNDQTYLTINNHNYFQQKVNIVHGAYITIFCLFQIKKTWILKKDLGIKKEISPNQIWLLQKIVETIILNCTVSQLYLLNQSYKENLNVHYFKRYSKPRDNVR